MNKSEFKEQAKNHLDIIFNKIENLESRKHKIPEDALEKYEQTIRNLKYKQVLLQEKYQELECVTDEQWKKTKTDFLNATSSVNETVKEISASI